MNNSNYCSNRPQSEHKKTEASDKVISANNQPESEEVDKHILKTISADKTLDEIVPESKNEFKPNEQEVIHFWSTKIFKFAVAIIIIVYIIILNILIIYPTEAKEIMNNFLLF
ncbi:hypothetical protein NEIG_01532 [Nematocida sp. ERTm5]|nr:hypothetical protein NEIG_01532 [Nematocida sp. ERTm5]